VRLPSGSSTPRASTTSGRCGSGCPAERRFCSPEPKAQQTAQLLTDGDVGIVDELREHERGPGDVVLVGHGTAWTLLVAELTGEPPDLERWRSLGMPDVITVPTRLR